MLHQILFSTSRTPEQSNPSRVLVNATPSVHFPPQEHTFRSSNIRAKSRHYKQMLTSLPELLTDCSDTTRHSSREGSNEEEAVIGGIATPPLRTAAVAPGPASINSKVAPFFLLKKALICHQHPHLRRREVERGKQRA